VAAGESVIGAFVGAGGDVGAGGEVGGELKTGAGVAGVPPLLFGVFVATGAGAGVSVTETGAIGFVGEGETGALVGGLVGGLVGFVGTIAMPPLDALGLLLDLEPK
jgi:hypothetical protein